MHAVMFLFTFLGSWVESAVAFFKYFHSSLREDLILQGPNLPLPKKSIKATVVIHKTASKDSIHDTFSIITIFF